MLVAADNHMVMSHSPHSLGLQNDLTTPSWGDSNYFINNQKMWNGAGMQGLYGVPGGGGYGFFGHGREYTGLMGCGCGGSCQGMGDLSSFITPLLVVAGLWYLLSKMR